MKYSRVREMLLAGISYKNIRQETGYSSATISYHTRKLGIQKISRPSYDWGLVQIDIENGMSISDLCNKYGFCKASYTNAAKVGKITKAIRFSEMSAEELQETFNGKLAGSYHRKLFRKHLSNQGWRCSECEIEEWRGKKLTLEVDHIDGNPRNNILSNLRLLCPNCHSTTDTWRGRNKGK